MARLSRMPKSLDDIPAFVILVGGLRVTTDPRAVDLGRFTLNTSTAAALYTQFGFTPLTRPECGMERFRPDTDQAPSP